MEDWAHLQDIQATLSDHLEGCLIGLCVTGSIACIETHRVARLLIRHGAKVQVFLSPSASELVSAKALGWCTGRPVITRLSERCEHLEFFSGKQPADLLLLAPATANTLGKMASGIDDNVVMTCLTTAAGAGVPILCAPGMHEPMMRNPAVLRSMSLLSDDGVKFLQPELSEGKQKMMTPPEIVTEVLRELGPADLAGRNVLITGGPTREFIDPARCVTNPSSGLTACLMAQEAYRRGARVTLVYGPGRVTPPSCVNTVRTTSAQSMLDSCLAALEEYNPDMVVAVAAVSDFRPRHVSDQKLPSSSDLSLELEATPKIIQRVREKVPEALMVGFKAAATIDDTELSELGNRYIREGIADIMVANSVSAAGKGFDSEFNRYVVTSKNSSPFILGPDRKDRLVPQLWERLSAQLRNL